MAASKCDISDILLFMQCKSEYNLSVSAAMTLKMIASTPPFTENIFHFKCKLASV